MSAELRQSYQRHERDQWLRRIEQATLEHRSVRSAHHRRRAIEAEQVACDCQAVREEGEPTTYLSPAGEPTTRRIGKLVTCVHGAPVHWHRVRAEGQLKRFRVVARCGTRHGRVVCGACNTPARELSEQCDQHRLCVRCRGRRAMRLRQRFRLARLRALRAFAPEQRGHRPGTSGNRRRWRERFITLTFPDSGDPSADVRHLVAAWPDFLRSVRRWIVRHHGVDKKLAARCPFVRVIEVTPGSAGGHAHLHVWALAPYLPHAILRVMWARALRSRAVVPTRRLEDCGLSDREARELRALHVDSERVPWPVVDVRAAYGDPGTELVKYLIKDIADEELIEPELFAAIYAALEARRTAVASRSFWLPDDACICGECGVVGEMTLELDRHPLELALTAGMRAPPPS